MTLSSPRTSSRPASGSGGSWPSRPLLHRRGPWHECVVHQCASARAVTAYACAAEALLVVGLELPAVAQVDEVRARTDAVVKTRARRARMCLGFSRCGTAASSSRTTVYAVDDPTRPSAGTGSAAIYGARRHTRPHAKRRSRRAPSRWGRSIPPNARSKPGHRAIVARAFRAPPRTQGA